MEKKVKILLSLILIFLITLFLIDKNLHKEDKKIQTIINETSQEEPIIKKD
jgi:preprotein translocase subunit YajC